jgi:galactokinase
MFLKVDIGQVEKLYSESSSERYNALVGTFNTVYGSKPEFICRAPGRVNIIGEHIDYEGYGVLPAAIEKDCLIAVRPI